MIRMLGNKAFRRDNHRRQRTFHVCRATAKQHAVTNGWLKGRIDPAIGIASRHHVGMPRERQRFALAAPCPEVLGVAKIHRFDGKTNGAQSFDKQRLAARVIGA